VGSHVYTEDFNFSQFFDENVYSGLRTLLSRFQPAQLLFERGSSKSITNLISSILPYTLIEYLFPKKDFIDVEEIIRTISNKNIFGSKTSEWPELIKKFIDTSGSIIKPPKVKDEYRECFKSFGAILSFLKRCNTAVDLINMKNFNFNNPRDCGEVIGNIKSTSNCVARPTKYIYGDAIYQLNLLPQPSPYGGKDIFKQRIYKINLFGTINNCSTIFGKRLLRLWIHAPTCDSLELAKRQSSVRLFCNSVFKDIITNILTHKRGFLQNKDQLSKHGPLYHFSDQFIKFEQFY
uniref:MUTSd domain-containing protein n=1 Tax=Strongyloides papillosus TaxID=174720 RepID=A0A0N5CIV4_STREA